MPTFINGVGSSQALDTAGEIVDLNGLDCSSLVGAPFNWEHGSSVPDQIVGKILEYKKIFSEQDCENEHHKYFWEKCKTPFLYVMGRLFDDKKDSSKEVAALFLDDAEHPDEPPIVGFSIEGSKINKSGIIVDKSIARKCTITCVPANKQCIAELLNPVEDEQDSDIDSIFKSEPVALIELFKAEVPGSKYPSAANAQPRQAPSPSTPKFGPIEQKPRNLGQKIGTTKSGKDVMSHAKPYDYKGWSSQDHQEAANMHHTHAQEGKGIPGASHFDTAKRHMAIAGRGERQEARLGAQRQAALKRPDMNVNRMERSEQLEKAKYEEGFTDTGKKKVREERASSMRNGPIKGVHTPTVITTQQAHKEKYGAPSHKYSGGKNAEGPLTSPGGKEAVKEVTSEQRKIKPNIPEPKKKTGTDWSSPHQKVIRHTKSESMEKALTAGSGMAAPGALTQGAALGKESLEGKKQNISMKKQKSLTLIRAEQEYETWTKREEYEKFMAKRCPSLTKGEIKAIGQCIALKKALKAEKKLKKEMQTGSELTSFVQKKEKA